MRMKWAAAGVGALCLLHLSAPGAAQTPAPAAESAPGEPAESQPSAVDRPPSDEAGGQNHQAADAQAPLEMTFGRGAGRPVPAPSPPASESSGTSRAPGRARTMEDVADAAAEELRVHNTRWRYSLNFFGDISLSEGKPAGADHQLGFALGAQDLLIRGELNNNIVATTEIALEPGNEGVSVDVERFNVRWQSSRFFVEAGRTHTAFGYWNNAYHHGRWLQPTIGRPRWVAFEDDGGILPVHWVGLGVGARLPVGAATLNLMATVGNGRGKIVDDVRNAGDYQAAKAYHLSMELVGIGRPELRVGVAGIFDRIPAQSDRTALPDKPISEMIGGAHVAYVNVPLLFIAEGYLVSHHADQQQWTTYGGFFLLGYAFGRVTPYAEIERIASKGGADPFFTITTPGSESESFDTIGGIAGLRIDLTDWTALKAEYRQTRVLDLKSTFHEGMLNWSWGF